MSLDLAFWIDPPETLKPAKDSSIAMMRAAAARGHRISVIGPQGLAHVAGCVQGMASTLTLAGRGDGKGGDWCSLAAPERRPLRDFDAILARKDPPFDIEYITATWLLQAAEREGARILNAPRALREHSEKLSILEFPEFTVPGLVCRDPDCVQAFIDAEGDTVLKPLDGMGGASVFRVRADDPNRNVIVETLTQEGARTVFAQRYIPEIAAGDKRILIIDGEPVPFALARVPKAGETRGNLAAGGTGIARQLTERDREIAGSIGSRLAPRGLFLIGIDVIGDWLTEINVTSPTCFVEITAQSDIDVAARFVAALEAQCTGGR